MPTRNGRSRPKALIAWSSGKDSAWALHAGAPRRRIRHCRRADHGDRLVRARQHAWRARGFAARAARAAGLPAIIVRIPYPCPNEIYEREMAKRRSLTPRRAASRILFSAICFLRTSAPIAKSSLPAPASRRCFRCGAQADRAAGARHDRRRRRGASCRRRLEEIAGGVCRPALRRGVAGDFPAGIDPAARTVNSILSCRPGRCWSAKFRSSRRDGRARWLCVCGFVAGSKRRSREAGAQGSRPDERVSWNAPVRVTSVTIFWPSASISASVMVFSRGCMVTAMAIDFLPGSMPLPS